MRDERWSRLWRFSAEGLVVQRYVLTASAEEVIAAFSGKFDELIADMQVDDQRDSGSSALQRMGYPTLRGAFAFPRELTEVIETFLGRDIVAHFVPFTDECKFVINGIDVLSVSEGNITFQGRCIARDPSVRRREAAR